jgi:hypothetical protein
MGNRSGKIDMPHPLAPYARMCNLDSATVADYALMLDSLELSTKALPIPLGAEYPLAEQTVLFGTVRPVINRLRLPHFAVGPVPNVLWRGKPDGNRAVIVDFAVNRIQHEEILPG